MLYSFARCAKEKNSLLSYLCVLCGKNLGHPLVSNRGVFKAELGISFAQFFLQLSN